MTGDRARRHASVLEALAADPSTPPPAARSPRPRRPAALRRRPGGRARGPSRRVGNSRSTPTRRRSVWFTRALAAAPPDTRPRWRAELLGARAVRPTATWVTSSTRAEAFLDAAELTDEPALLARAALGYADPGADLGIAYRTDDAVTARAARTRDRRATGAATRSTAVRARGAAGGRAVLLRRAVAGPASSAARRARPRPGASAMPARSVRRPR